MGTFTINTAKAVDLVLAATAVDGGGVTTWDIQGGFDGETVSVSGVMTGTNISDAEVVPAINEAFWYGKFKFVDLGLTRTKDVSLSGTPGSYLESATIQNIVKTIPGAPASVTFTIMPSC